MEIEARRILLRANPFFERFSHEDLTEILELSTQHRYADQDVIVREGDLVDSVYIICSGEIEVSVAGIPRQLLHKGDAIGLTERGFFSTTGLRTATLKALGDIELMAWHIQTFHQFLTRHPELVQSKETALKMMRAYFIKQIAPFADLPPSVIISLANEINEVKIPAGTTLFEQGDFAGECYLVTSGEVQLIIDNKDGAPRIVDTITTGRFFGEGAVLGVQERSAKAFVSQDATLLVLRAEQLHALMDHPPTAKAIMGLVVEHWRPKKSAGIQVFHRTDDEGLPVTILKDQRRGTYYRLSENGSFIWERLDGQRKLEDVTLELYRARQVFSPKGVSETILNLAEAGFVILPELKQTPVESPSESPSFWQRCKRQAQKWRVIGWVDNSVDAKFARLYRVFVHKLFWLPSQILIAAIVLAGVVCFCLVSAHYFFGFQHQGWLIWAIAGAFLAHLASGFVHEIAHGFTVKYFKHEVHRAGFFFSWTGLLAFVDTSDMWLAPRGPRVIVSLAGPYSDLVLAGISSVLALIFENNAVALFFWFLAIALYLSVLKNLNPLQETDGYMALKDMLAAPELHSLAFRTPFSRKSLVFWIAVFLFLTANIIIAFIVQYYIRLIIPSTVFGISSDNIIWLLPSLVLVVFVVTLVRYPKKLQPR